MRLPILPGCRRTAQLWTRQSIAFTIEADDALYARPLSYTNSAGESHTKPAGLVLRHVFNHQTHHRGQVTTLFSQLGIDVGVTDLSALIPECDG